MRLVQGRWVVLAVAIAPLVVLSACSYFDDDSAKPTACRGPTLIAVPRNNTNSGKFDGRGLHVVVTDGNGSQRRISGNLNAGEPSFSPDGSRVVMTGLDEDDGTYLAVVGANGRSRTRWPGGRDGEDPDWSPDGSTIAFVRSQYGKSSELHLLDATRGGTDRVIVSVKGHDVELMSPSWSADGRRLTFLEVEGRHTRIDTPTNVRSSTATARTCGRSRAWVRSPGSSGLEMGERCS